MRDKIGTALLIVACLFIAATVLAILAKWYLFIVNL